MSHRAPGLLCWASGRSSALGPSRARICLPRPSHAATFSLLGRTPLMNQTNNHGLYRGWKFTNFQALGSQRRRFSLNSIPAPILVPLIFTGLLITLWTYKCLMMILFQNKIIYMPSMPPFSRSEKIEDYEALCKPVVWREERIRATDGVVVALAVGSIGGNGGEGERWEKEVVVLYFQGNGGSLPPRMPDLSRVLKALQGGWVKYTIVALSYRGYWISRGSASERGIKLDAAAAVSWVVESYPHASVVLWGQSIGAGVATAAAAAYRNVTTANTAPTIAALILETPFTSIHDMLTALYPQKWLPYRYLYPFLWSHWDSRAALAQISRSPNKPQVLIVVGERDEVVPRDHAYELEAICRATEIPVNRVVVQGALHHEILIKSQGRKAIADFLRRVGDG